MGLLHDCARSITSYHEETEREVRALRADPTDAKAAVEAFAARRAAMPTSKSFIGTEMPLFALPDHDEAGVIHRFLRREGYPGEFPFTQCAYERQYLIEEGAEQGEEPTRMFAGLGLAEDTNERFHLLAANQRSHRLSTAFDGVTLYGMDADAEGVLGKVGEGGVSISTVEDMERLYQGFDLTAPSTSVSMTINGPAPILMAQFIVAAARREWARAAALKPNGSAGRLDPEEKRRILLDCAAKLRGTVQADILKEVQAQNETLFPLEPSLRLLGDMVDWCADNAPRWYPVSISGYHIAEAGADPVEQLAFTLGNGLYYADAFRRRGMDLEKVVPRFSFFFQFDYDLESAVIGRVARRAWAIAMRRHFGLGDRAARLKFHAQTSGRSLTEQGLLNNITRTALQVFLALANYANSAHSNSYDEAITTPTAEAALIASQTQALLLEETGMFRHTMGLFTTGPGLSLLTDRVEEGVARIWEEMDRVGGVIEAVETRYVRGRIQDSFYKRAQQAHAGERRLVGVNCYRNEEEARPRVELSRTSKERQRLQADRTRAFKAANSEAAEVALRRLADAAERDADNVFAELLDAVEVCSLGQITGTLQESWGRFRAMV
ncbi:MAG: methylmalonyl-CoA mutase family protein [Candidatus Sumerlaeia bacterium]|nr:methylmalonyl-CoA mutase family protein [Candidatus Sumerlaeia bacterium]